MDYKATLNLPRTDFPMKANLPQREPELLAWWEQERLYDRIQEAGKKANRSLYVLHDGPPYANGRIHIGHALNKILKDIIVKSKTMAGFWAPYIPGWDCHGLPIEHQVLKELGDKKKTLDTPAIRKLCRDYADKYFKIQRDEFKRLGVLGDWDHPYLTMDPAYEATILREFGKFVAKGGVYKGLKPVLWCTIDQTALAEAEVEYEDHTSPSIYVKFPLVNPPDMLGSAAVWNLPFPKDVKAVSLVIWTTTPWTLPANQAICLHPEIDYAFVKVGPEVLVMARKLVDDVAKACALSGYQVLGVKKGSEGFEGLETQRPLADGLSPIVLGDFVTVEQGTGCVHIAPGHGQEDYELVLEYNRRAAAPGERLEIVAPVDDAGRFTEAVREFAGQHVLKANPAIIERLRANGRLLGSGTLTHSYPHCWRCKQPVIFRATEQWFVSMEKGDLRRRTLKEIDRVRWIPARGRDRIFGMIENRPDWCLSRQRVWGVPIPGFTCTACKTVLADPTVIEHVSTLVERQGVDVWFEKPVAELIPRGTACSKCGGTTFEKERDILDVWFESGVSHAAVLKPRGQGWWPAHLYLEGSDQHRGWFHSALLCSVTTDGRAPYQAVLTHGFVVDGEGKKMSKSAGNVVAPQDVIKQSGAEILRFWVAAQDYQEDLRISQNILSQLVEQYRKIRNTCRFLLSNLFDYDKSKHAVRYDQMPELDRWALLKLNNLITKVRDGYENFNFRQIVHELDYFCSVDMSAIYLDIIKDRLYTFHKDSLLRRSSQTVLFEVLVSLAKLMAPILSFTAEEIWRTSEIVRQRINVPSVHMASFPDINANWITPDLPALEQRWEDLLEIRSAVQSQLEAMRREKVIGSSLEAKVILYAKRMGPALYNDLKSYEDFLPSLFIVSQVDLHAVDTLPMNIGGLTDLDPGGVEGLVIKVGRADGKKCERCWNYRPAVGTIAEHPTLCDRCVEAIR